MKTSHPSPFTLRHLAFVLLATVCLAALPARAQTYWGYALSFNGANSYVSFGATPPLSSPWTAEFWVNRQDSTNTAAALLDDGITSLRLEQYYETKRVGFTKYGAADYTFNYTAPTNTWVHLAFVSDTTRTYLYVNGVVQDTNANTISLPLTVFGAVTNGAGAANSAIKGTIDEIRIWNVVRSSTDIRADLAQPLTNAPAGLVAYWKFDEGTGTNTYDATANHHNGTLVNGPTWVVSTVPVPFTYTTNNGTITITGYTGPGGAVTIPATINDLSVTSIGDDAFSSSASLTSITIPDSVITIGVSAFDTCTSLSSVILGNGVTSIGDAAFEYCSSLNNVTIPNSVTTIGLGAFFDCTGLTNVTIGDGVTSIGWAVFINCTGLTSITIPSSVTSIGFAAFEDCTSLSNVTILGSDTYLGDYAFCGCSSLTGVYCQGNAPILGGPSVFAVDSPSGGELNVTVYYLAGTTGWAEFDADSRSSGLSLAVLWNAQVQTGDGHFGVRTNRFGFTIVGTTNIPVVVDACTNLASAAWTTLQTCTVTNGSIYFCDPLWTNYPERFYRVRWP